VLMVPASVRIFLATDSADMRKGFDSLSLLVERAIGEDPFSGHLFVFRNRRGDRVKILFWDRSGWALFYKRLEKGVFRFPEVDGPSVRVEAAELILLLEGIDLAGAKRRTRYARSVTR
jgi:transposase